MSVQTNYVSPIMPEFTFTALDVEANRQGRLTPDQQQKIEQGRQFLQKQRRGTRWFYVLFFPGLILIGFVMEASRTGEAFLTLLPRIGLSLLLIALCLIPLFLIAGFWTFMKEADVRRQRVSAFEGEAVVESKERRARYTRYMTHELTLRGKLGKRTFYFPNQESLAHFENGKCYRVYYIRFTPFDIVLSMESV
jgi:hypothetical protein